MKRLKEKKDDTSFFFRYIQGGTWLWNKTSGKMVPTFSPSPRTTLWRSFFPPVAIVSGVRAVF